MTTSGDRDQPYPLGTNVQAFRLRTKAEFILRNSTMDNVQEVNNRMIVQIVACGLRHSVDL
jgi:hypothetical protein